MRLKYYIQKLLGRWLDSPVILKGKTIGYSLVRSEKYNVIMGKYTKVYPPFFLHNVKLGDYTVVAFNVHAANVTVGKCCSIGPSFCCGLGLHPTGGVSTSAMFYSPSKLNGMTLTKEKKYDEEKATIIGNDVYIGANVMVLDGVHIADGAVIGAGAVVTDDIPPYAVAVGVPAKVVKYRFDEPTIKALLEKQWWNGTMEELKKVERHFWDIETFLKE